MRFYPFSGGMNARASRRNMVRLPRMVAALLTVAVMAYVVYGLAATSFVRWPSMPFTASSGRGEGFGGRGENSLRGDRRDQRGLKRRAIA